MLYWIVQKVVRSRRYNSTRLLRDGRCKSEDERQRRSHLSRSQCSARMLVLNSHRFWQIVKARFGTSAHLLFTFYAFLCVLIVCGSLLRAFHLYSYIFSCSWCTGSGRSSYCECIDRHGHYRSLLSPSDRHRGIRRCRRPTRNVYLRLGAYYYSLHHYIPLRGTCLVRHLLNSHIAYMKLIADLVGPHPKLVVSTNFTIYLSRQGKMFQS